jgi:hypothetical protein
MTPEERLTYIPLWIEHRIDCQLSRRASMDTFWYCLNELGILIAPSIVDNPIPTFQQYLQLIENQKSNQ